MSSPNVVRDIVEGGALSMGDGIEENSLSSTVKLKIPTNTTPDLGNNSNDLGSKISAESQYKDGLSLPTVASLSHIRSWKIPTHPLLSQHEAKVIFDRMQAVVFYPSNKTPTNLNNVNLNHDCLSCNSCQKDTPEPKNDDTNNLKTHSPKPKNQNIKIDASCNKVNGSYIATKIAKTSMDQTKSLHAEFHTAYKNHMSTKYEQLGMDFRVWEYSQCELYGFSLGMFARCGLIADEKGMNILLAFIIDVAKSYMDNPYHTFLHAVDVAYVIFWTLTDLRLWELLGLNSVHVASLLLAALAHDSLHPGLNNGYQINARTTTAEKFQGQSVLERLSIEELNRLLDLHPVLETLKLDNSIEAIKTTFNEDYIPYMRNLMNEAILNTDMCFHFELLKMLGGIAEDLGRPLENNTDEDLERLIYYSYDDDFDEDNDSHREYTSFNFNDSNKSINNNDYDIKLNDTTNWKRNPKKETSSSNNHSLDDINHESLYSSQEFIKNSEHKHSFSSNGSKSRNKFRNKIVAAPLILDNILPGRQRGASKSASTPRLSNLSYSEHIDIVHGGPLSASIEPLSHPADSSVRLLEMTYGINGNELIASREASPVRFSSTSLSSNKGNDGYKYNRSGSPVSRLSNTIRSSSSNQNINDEIKSLDGNHSIWDNASVGNSSINHCYCDNDWNNKCANCTRKSRFSDNYNDSLCNTVGEDDFTNDYDDTDAEDYIRPTLSEEQRRMLILILLHAADISNAARPFDICKVWSDMVVEEFFLQGEQEKNSNLPISPNMDRESTAPSQIGFDFNEFVVRPYFEVFSELIPTLKVFVENLWENRSVWEMNYGAIPPGLKKNKVNVNNEYDLNDSYELDDVEESILINDKGESIIDDSGVISTPVKSVMNNETYLTIGNHSPISKPNNGRKVSFSSDIVIKDTTSQNNSDEGYYLQPNNINGSRRSSYGSHSSTGSLYKDLSLRNASGVDTSLSNIEEPLSALSISSNDTKGNDTTVSSSSSSSPPLQSTPTGSVQRSPKRFNISGNSNKVLPPIVPLMFSKGQTVPVQYQLAHHHHRIISSSDDWNTNNSTIAEEQEIRYGEPCFLVSCSQNSDSLICDGQCMLASINNNEDVILPINSYVGTNYGINSPLSPSSINSANSISSNLAYKHQPILMEGNTKVNNRGTSQTRGRRLSIAAGTVEIPESFDEFIKRRSSRTCSKGRNNNGNNDFAKH